MSATDKWVWERFSFLKDHIESVERRKVVSIRGRGREPTEVIIQSDSGSAFQPTEPPSHRLSTESVDLKRSLMEFMSDKKGGPSSFARHIDESLTQLPGDIKRATQIKLMEVLHEGQRLKSVMGCFSRCPPSHSSSNRSPQSSQSSHNVSRTYQAPPVGNAPKEWCQRVTSGSLHHHCGRHSIC
ncbi:hypothetical protein DPMN_112086 [Dreissena polymorpha]|uniref:Uncharacterized protein n=1 Tax=Dreissena polymorpha TaxID=45954 RepID=A0A9D4KGE2_DREPO|nr:hypothetical protein DPMN_112086 [Dreissena polymorpha]